MNDDSFHAQPSTTGQPLKLTFKNAKVYFSKVSFKSKWWPEKKGWSHTLKVTNQNKLQCNIKLMH